MRYATEPYIFTIGKVRVLSYDLSKPAVPIYIRTMKSQRKLIYRSDLVSDGSRI